MDGLAQRLSTVQEVTGILDALTAVAFQCVAIQCCNICIRSHPEQATLSNISQCRNRTSAGRKSESEKFLDANYPFGGNNVFNAATATIYGINPLPTHLARVVSTK